MRMKKTRFALLVLLISAIAAVVGGYYAAEKRNQLLAPAKPAPLPSDLHSIANNWSWSQSSKDHPVVEAHAQDFRQIKDSSRFELGGVEMKIFSKAGDTYDLVRSKQAEFDQEVERLYSEGEVTIVLGLPADSPPPPGKRYVEIRTSGLTYDNKTGISATDRPVHFTLENGDGDSVGALYDANKRYLWMKKNPVIIGAGPQAGMRIRAGELMYYEAEQKVELRPWSKLERGGQGVEAGNSVVYLEDGNLKRVDAERGRGWDIGPDRQVHFQGDRIEVNFTPQQTLASASGIGGAEVVSQSESGVTKITGGRVDLEFRTPAGAAESELTAAYVRDHGRLESTPLAQNGTQAETKVLTAEVIQVEMRPGGRDLQKLQTHAPGRLELIPNQPDQWKRTLTAERMTAEYLPGNRPGSLRAAGSVFLRSDPPAAAVKAARPAGGAPQTAPALPRLTWSDDLAASFDPETGDIRELHQWNNFRYEEGMRRAQAADARFDAASDRVTFENRARVWDESSMITAARIVLDQQQDRLHAEGDVTSTHLGGISAAPHPGPTAVDSGSIFSPEKPVHATAQQLDSERHNHLLHYRRSARLWQDGNSIEAQEIEVDREKKTLRAAGSVISVLTEDDQPGGDSAPSGGQSEKPPAWARPPGQRLVRVTSDSLVYTDQDRRAYYAGHVILKRERMLIRAAALEAYLRPQEQVENGESRIDRAVAEGKVEIVETPLEKRTPRKASAEHAEYYSNEEKIILRGGNPVLEQPGRGSTRGSELTYYLDDDRLLVNGRPGARSQTREKIKHD